MDTIEERANETFHDIVDAFKHSHNGEALSILIDALQAERDEGYEAGQSDMRKENRRLKEELQDLRDEMEEELSEAVHLLRRPTFSSASFIKKHSGEI